jgi:hypothetical protein
MVSRLAPIIFGLSNNWVMIHGGGATARWASSGIPHGLVAGLAPHVAVTRVSSDLPHTSRLTDLSRRIYGDIGPATLPFVLAKDVRLRRNSIVRDADVVISMGSGAGFRISSRKQFRVLYEDMTVAQSPLASGPAKDRWIARQRRHYSETDLCCAATSWVADSLRDDYGVPDAKIELVGFGANVPCEPVPKDWAQPRYLWVGVDWLRKGGDVLLAAWEHAAIPGATLDLVGRHPEELPPTVTGHGLVRDPARLRRFFEEATVFVLPSRFEAAGIVLLEAAAAGTPSIGTNVGGLPFNLGPSGLLIPPEDVDALSGALVSMSDQQFASKFVEPAIAHAAQFTWQAVAQRVFDAVRERRASTR